MSLSHTQVMEKYIEGVKDHAVGNSLEFEGDVLYSHFLGELAIRGKWGSGVDYIINGDGYSFVNHNRLAINSLRAPDHNNIVQIPFSALAAAGMGEIRTRGNYSIGLDRKIRIIDTRDDRYWNVCGVCGKIVQRHPYGEALPYEQSRLIDPEEKAYFSNKKRWWQPAPYALVEKPGTYRFKWIHIHDKSDVCHNLEFPLGRMEQRHELGATVIRHGRKYYLSSIDYDEPRRNYFLCQLPKKVNTLDEAYEVLMPIQVSYAKALGKEVIRQGDIYAIKSDVTTRDLTRPTFKQRQLYGTTHIATDVRHHLGKVYARGSIRHAPGLIDPNRRPQHIMRVLGKDWWEVYKNTARGSWQVNRKVD